MIGAVVVNDRRAWHALRPPDAWCLVRSAACDFEALIFPDGRQGSATFDEISDWLVQHEFLFGPAYNMEFATPWREMVQWVSPPDETRALLAFIRWMGQGDASEA